MEGGSEGIGRYDSAINIPDSLAAPPIDEPVSWESEAFELILRNSGPADGNQTVEVLILSATSIVGDRHFML
jgi:hypothetical protein